MKSSQSRQHDGCVACLVLLVSIAQACQVERAISEAGDSGAAAEKDSMTGRRLINEMQHTSHVIFIIACQNHGIILSTTIVLLSRLFFSFAQSHTTIFVSRENPF